MKSASLNSSLLTRKGAAAPATFLPAAEPSKPAPEAGSQPAPPPLALHGAPRALPKPAQPAPKGGGRTRGDVRGAGRTRLSLRLDREQHLKIRLASVHLGQSAQAIVLAALERYLEEVAPTLGGGSCLCLGADAPTPGLGIGGARTANGARPG